ncbi:MAG: outer membrane lipoprotein carrier protein LolA [Alphaproteobacteria bacterium]|nr:outer membrane lipoprotein carrier protein LolA [Alphaproteobacteria bacterium]
MRALYLLLVGLTMAGSAFAQSPSTATKPKVPSPDFTAATALVEEYFNSLTTLQAAFSQTQSDRPREVAQGTFSLNRPQGQFLWQYQTPVRQRIIGTGTAVYYVDQSATQGDNQVTQLPLDAGLGRLLRGQRLSLGKVGLRVNGVQTKGESRSISLAALPQRRDEQGLRRVVLTFTGSRANPTLAGFTATDMLGVTTQVSFTNAVRGGKFPRGMFDFTPPQYRQR